MIRPRSLRRVPGPGTRLVRRLRVLVVRGIGAADGQTTAEYALVILGAAAVATLLVTWATNSHAISRLFDTVIGKIAP